ncbi:MAG: MerR family transcriptional regulator [Alphaproteobacteria bacterium]|nr:MerR family transcriptional regulator [Alphaproteobacteria bacterium]
MSFAAFAYPAKSAEAFRTISEVADELDVPQHVLRFWESRFGQIRPVKRAGGRRYYRPEDIDLLKGIQALLYGEGFTIKGVQKVLKERGVRHVAALGRDGATPPVAPEPLVIEKIVYVEKAVPKKRPAHLRPVGFEEMTLPFFDAPAATPAEEPAAEVTVPAKKAARAARSAGVAGKKAGASHKVITATDDEASRLAGEERARLEELLDGLTGLKARLAAARSGGK